VVDNELDSAFVVEDDDSREEMNDGDDDKDLE